MFFPPGLNDPAPAAGKETSENNQWSMFEVKGRVSEKRGERLSLQEVLGHTVTLEKYVITHAGKGAV